jgi:hypothetical protein
MELQALPFTGSLQIELQAVLSTRFLQIELEILQTLQCVLLLGRTWHTRTTGAHVPGTENVAGQNDWDTCSRDSERG